MTILERRYKIDGKNFYSEVESFPVYDMEGNELGIVYYPVDRSILDCVDCPLTVWASDNGLSVDDIYCEA